MMQLDFNDKQIELLQDMGFAFDCRKDLSTFEFYLIVERVAGQILQHGLDEQQHLNETGSIYQGIMETMCIRDR